MSSATGGYYKVGKPYTVRGKTYYPKADEDYSEVGMASWYGGGFHGGKTANGETYNMMSISAAHKTLPMPSYVRVTNLKNNRSIIVRVNNRGPFVRGRLIDVSKRTAELLDFKQFGVAKVRVDYVGPASIDGSDHKQLAGTLRTDGVLASLPGQESAVQVAEAKPLVPEMPEVVPASHGEIPVPLTRPADAQDQVQVASAEWVTGSEPVSGLGYAGVPGSDAGQ
ncbi:septal ring lytic transglycosylase RlpA family protein [Xanthobacter sp. TB0139]|uniref:septal ring lytic transglycosylase RlpA family protein n=1 Tax=Xanthobacter sp. TB0139 TaxID=3459178 RepID=UPI004039D2CD